MERSETAAGVEYLAMRQERHGSLARKDWTDDAICFAMGLGAFVPTEPAEAIRLLCLPSFGPEVCVTASPSELVAVSLTVAMHRQPHLGRLPEHADRAACSPEEFAAFDAAFDEALDEASRPPKWVTIADGMQVSAARRRGDRLELLSRRDSGNTGIDWFIQIVLEAAYPKARAHPLRQRLAHCHNYVARGDARKNCPWVPSVPEPTEPGPLLVPVMVLGTPEARADFHRLHGVEPPRPR